MQSVYMIEPNAAHPVEALRRGDRPLSDRPTGWTTVAVKAASLNRHDLFALGGVGPAMNNLPDRKSVV